MEDNAYLPTVLPVPFDSSDIKLNNDSKSTLFESLKPFTSEEKSEGKKKSAETPDFVSSILDNDEVNVIGFFENVDPMLAWAMLKSRILPQVSSFDIITEKAK